MKITNARFVKGVVRWEDLPDDERPEVAFIGRSNVGKSSLLNRLVAGRFFVASSASSTAAATHFFTFLGLALTNGQVFLGGDVHLLVFRLVFHFVVVFNRAILVEYQKLARRFELGRSSQRLATGDVQNQRSGLQGVGG